MYDDAELTNPNSDIILSDSCHYNFAVGSLNLQNFQCAMNMSVRSDTCLLGVTRVC
jgi:hypothetical protein